METNEIRDFVLNSNHREFYENLELTFPFLDSTGSITKRGLTSIFEFVERKIKGYQDIAEVRPSVLKPTNDYFLWIKKDLTKLIRTTNNRTNPPESAWENLKSVNKRNQGNGIIDPFSPETKFLIELNKSFPKLVQGAFNYIIGQEIPKEKHGFAGALKAYEFSMDGGAKISRTSAEKATLTKFSREIEVAINQSNQSLIDHLSISQKKSEEFSKQIDELKKGKDKLISDWFANSQKEFEELSEKIDSRRQELEKTYKEIFFLKEPAKYWKDRAEELGKDGKKYLIYLYILIGIGGGSLFLLLWQIPDGILLNIFKGEASAIKWTIVYVTFISFLAFGIKTLSKLAYSTFHLKRDAEERHQLTYVYLSLVNEKKIDEKDRQLILQSLFSRSDTGLLKDDSSPTMPGVIDSVFRSGKV